MIPRCKIIKINKLELPNPVHEIYLHTYKQVHAR